MLEMGSFAIISIAGFVIGYILGVGCSVAVTYSIYLGGYRKAVEDSLRPEKSERYLRMLPKIQSSLARQQAIDAQKAKKV